MGPGFSRNACTMADDRCNRASMLLATVAVHTSLASRSSFLNVRLSNCMCACVLVHGDGVSEI